MKALIQVVKNCNLEVSNKLVSKIDFGLLAYIGILKTDTEKDILYLKEKILNLRIFYDQQKVMNLSLLDTKAEIMLVSQFTLYANTKKGRRPSYHELMPPNQAISFFEKILEIFKQDSDFSNKVKAGIFGEEMDITYTNIGPRSFIIETNK